MTPITRLLTVRSGITFCLHVLNEDWIGLVDDKKIVDEVDGPVVSKM